MRNFVRALAFAVGTFFALAAPSFEAGSHPATLQFSPLPARAVAGQLVTVGVARAKAGARCTLAVRYANAQQPGLAPAIALGGRATWSWTIPDSTQAAWAKLTAACGTKLVSTRLLVVGALSPPKMSVVKDGFSVRAASFGPGTEVSYGVIIRNTSSTIDAQNVSVNVNFVLADNRLLGSASTTVPAIPAGSTYDLGNVMSFPAAAPIARLEVVMHVSSTAPHTGHAPGLENVVIEPSLTDPGWVGDVAGEVINNDPRKILQNVQFSAVILDAAGNVIGGGNGTSYGVLPPGTRLVFKLTGGGFRDIPVPQASSALVSATPTWQ